MPDSENRIRRKLGQLLLLPVFIAITPAAFADEIVTFADLPEHLLWEQRVACSNHVAPTNKIKGLRHSNLERSTNIHSLRLRLGGRWRRTSEIRTGSLGVSTSRRFSKAMRYSLK